MCDFSVSIKMALRSASSHSPQIRRTVARRDLDLAPILAAFAPFLLEEKARDVRPFCVRMDLSSPTLAPGFPLPSPHPAASFHFYLLLRLLRW
jgi:hypothetical protein